MKEQCRIMAQIEDETRASAQAIANARADAFDQRSANPVLNNVGAVAIHGQEKTRAAIANETVIVANCLCCQTRVQVTHTATLMKNPVCEIVGPVERLSVEEEMDRRLAEQLQNELYAEDHDEEEKQESWWDSMTSVTTSSASANHVTTENETEESITFPNSLQERKGLLLKDNSARVAERRPHFSCVLDSVTSVADAFTSLPKD